MLTLLVSPGGRLANHVQRLWGWLIVRSALSDARLEGRERIPRGRGLVVVANHASYLDPPTLMAVLPLPVRFVMKRELGRLPFLGWYVRLAGHVLIDRSDARAGAATLAKGIERAQRLGLCPVVFPEGTRSPDGRLAAFRTGSFALALDTGFDLLPVAILGTHAVLPKRALAPRRSGRIVVRVGEPVPVAGLEGGAGRRVLAERVRAALVALGVPDGEGVPA
jgi:1-acyl-sn-glycerol-3-phosphate acyltransferase